MVHKALTIAGSDNSGGAGIQADLKVFSAFGVYGMSAISSITVQNSMGVQNSYPVSPDIVYQQIQSVAEDIKIDAFKTGMLQTEENVIAVYQAVKDFKLKNFVVDTVIRSKNGRFLLDKDAVETFVKRIIPICDVITPNIDEAEEITGKRIKNIDDMKKAAVEISKIGAKAVVIKGGHLPQENKVTDVIYYRGDFVLLEYPFVKTKNTHGTGCTFSAAITACLAKGIDTIKSIRIARAYTQGAIENSITTGKGVGSLNHFWTVL
ncbi:hydroxymethylpyrimidine/phosphomethylpyrimidine kinase [Persephonella hydrogeniphila]|uniref:hydroxymethylpyrimidine kinase n=1 Tax=Persephonella hydrogeniphila TaxID=198703 RepID=A0A285NB87_9AQUI|nr:bifunctional hydroxymethylpyrimidine kinase/phosphomethylpyrimidine kinase [Persephonella hydrogeniphila]SNZ06744.1 hydroxymethylpyrimidine/phosphomethylpyrimidine kinase [Persephonella hydrogeniphila]